MADSTITGLPAATTPLAGTEVLPIDQSGVTSKVAISDVTAGRLTTTLGVTVTGAPTLTNTVYLPAANTVGIATNGTLRASVSNDTFVMSSASADSITQVGSFFQPGIVTNTRYAYVGIGTGNGADNLASFGYLKQATVTAFISVAGDNPLVGTGLFVNRGGNTGIGISTPDGTLHVHTATAGTVTANASADDLVVENSGAGGISILVPDANNGMLAFGSPTDNLGAYVSWNYSNDSLVVATHKTGGVLRLYAGLDVPNLTLSGAAGSELATFVKDASLGGQVAFSAARAYSAAYTIRRDSGDSLVFSGGTNGYFFNRGDNTVTDFTISGTGNATFAGDVTLSEGKLTLTDTANEAAVTVTSSATDSNGVFVSLPSITTGNGLYVFSASTNASARNLVYINNSEAAATGTVVLNIAQASTGDALRLTGGDLTMTEGKLTITDTANENAVSITSSALTVSAVVLTVNDLTTGNGMLIRSTSGDTSARSLLDLTNSSTAATGLVNVRMQQSSANAFIDFVGTAGANTTDPISTLTTSGATTGHIQIDINGTKAWIAVSTNNPS